MLPFHSLRRIQPGPVTWRNVALRTVPRAPICPLIRATSQSPGAIRSKATSTSTSTAAAVASKPTNELPNAYGPKLCVYHAGTGRITFASCLKLTTLFICAFFGFVVTPAYYQKEGLSVTVARTAVCAVAPLVFVAYITNPMVTFIHIRLPPFVRRSEEMLRRYARSLPPHTELEITTMSLIAKPRVSTVNLSELKPVNKRFGTVNMTRDTTAANAAKEWYKFRAVGNFGVREQSGVSRAPWVWDEINTRVRTKQSC
ncbi:hypothetical protein GGS24DRAFT_501389 [Hypoxylon argillaceum]|nr:hypothetical protein GGS24DRAFT_501389 [Hypoxylon argillaceum]